MLVELSVQENNEERAKLSAIIRPCYISSGFVMVELYVQENSEERARFVLLVDSVALVKHSDFGDQRNLKDL